MSHLAKLLQTSDGNDGTLESRIPLGAPLSAVPPPPPAAAAASPLDTAYLPSLPRPLPSPNLARPPQAPLLFPPALPCSPSSGCCSPPAASSDSTRPLSLPIIRSPPPLRFPLSTRRSCSLFSLPRPNS
jgi:hypothetical protein